MSGVIVEKQSGLCRVVPGDRREKMSITKNQFNMNKKVKKKIEEIHRMVESRYDNDCDNNSDEWALHYENILVRIQEITEELLNNKTP
jgi:hypothetical protein